MDFESYCKIRDMSRLTDFLLRFELVSEPYRKLAVSCYDRAILVTEVPKTVLGEFFGFSASDEKNLQRLVSTVAFECSAESHIVGRHLPPIKATQGDFSDFIDFTLSLKTRDWSYSQYAAAVPSPSAFQLAEAVKSVYNEESDHAKAVSRFAVGVYLFLEYGNDVLS